MAQGHEFTTWVNGSRARLGDWCRMEVSIALTYGCPP